MKLPPKWVFFALKTSLSMIAIAADAADNDSKEPEDDEDGDTEMEDGDFESDLLQLMEVLNLPPGYARTLLHQANGDIEAAVAAILAEDWTFGELGISYTPQGSSCRRKRMSYEEPNSGQNIYLSGQEIARYKSTYVIEVRGGVFTWVSCTGRSR